MSSVSDGRSHLPLSGEARSWEVSRVRKVGQSLSSTPHQLLTPIVLLRRALQLTELRTNLQDCLGALDPTATPTSTLASVSAAATPVTSTSKLPPASAERSRMRRSSEGLEDLAEPLSNPLSLLASISLRGTSEAPNGDFETWLEASQRYYGSGKGKARQFRLCRGCAEASFAQNCTARATIPTHCVTQWCSDF